MVAHGGGIEADGAEPRRHGVGRRAFVGTAVATAAAFGSGFWRDALAAPASVAVGPFGSLDGRPPDENGVVLPPGFRSRVVARTGEPVPGTDYHWPVAPDGQATFSLPDGGWVLVTNAEWGSPAFLSVLGQSPEQAALGGGVSAVRFDRRGRIADAYRIVDGADICCAGGPTPWGTWLSGEEYEFADLSLEQLATSLGAVGAYYAAKGSVAGQIWEADPTGATPGRPLPALGAFKHEAAAVDPSTNVVYLTEDEGDGLLYRFVSDTPNVGGRPDLSNGRLQAAALTSPDAVLTTGSAVAWLDVPDPSAQELGPTRRQVPGATVFRRGEGMWFDDGDVYFTTTADDRVWALTPASSYIAVVHDPLLTPSSPLREPDNICAHPQSGDLFVAEDDDNLEVVLITSPDDPAGRTISPFCRFESTPEVPHEGTEVTGPCFDPSGRRMYVSSQRGLGPTAGITYEIRGPFRSLRRTDR